MVNETLAKSTLERKKVTHLDYTPLKEGASGKAMSCYRAEETSGLEEICKKKGKAVIA